MAATNENENVNDPSNAARGPGVAIPAGALALTKDSRYVLVSTAGTITGRLVGDTADVAYVIPVGLHKMAFLSVTSSLTIVGHFLF